jgi:hypothetical protein
MVTTTCLQERATALRNRTNESERFDNSVDRLLKIPHSEIKAKLDAEKAARKPKSEAKKSNT